MKNNLFKKTISVSLLIIFCSNLFAQEHNKIKGFSFFDKIIGLWNGPVKTDTPAGDFKVWYVDFRPISSSEVAQFTNLDANTINYTSFFVVKYKEKLKIAMRTEGVFMNKGCVTYEVLDSVNESKGYYRFSDFQSGVQRAYTEFIFKNDKLTMQTFTNKFNQQKTLTLHSKWEATLADRKPAMQAKEHFNYPQSVMVKDFTYAFNNMDESIYFTFKHEPYPSNEKPYVGSVTVNIKKDKKLKWKKTHELFILLTTESLFDGYKYIPDNLKYFSKYAFLPVETESYTFTNVHPGTYYLYSYNDVNGDKHHQKNDYMSSNLEHKIVVVPEKNIKVETTIDYKIP